MIDSSCFSGRKLNCCALREAFFDLTFLPDWLKCLLPTDENIQNLRQYSYVKEISCLLKKRAF